MSPTQIVKHRVTAATARYLLLIAAICLFAVDPFIEPNRVAQDLAFICIVVSLLLLDPENPPGATALPIDPSDIEIVEDA